MRAHGLLLFIVPLTAACSRTGLDLVAGGSDGGTPANDASIVSCIGDAGVGNVTRIQTLGQAGYGVIDPVDDVYLEVGGLDAEQNYAASVTSIGLADGASHLVSLSGAAVSLGPVLRPVWEPTYARTIVLGGGIYGFDSQMTVDDSHQVFALTLSGTAGTVALLPNFPEGQTNDIPLPAIADPVSARLYAVADKGSTPGPIQTYALGVTPGRESWSLFFSDASADVTNIEIVGLFLDPVGHRLIGTATTLGDNGLATLWALSIDSPSGWTQIQGTFPASLAGYTAILGGGALLTYDDTLCSFVVGATTDSCEYQFWGFDIGTSFTATALGVTAQPPTRYGRGLAGYDVRRKNFVFGQAYDCDYEQDYLALSTDFVPVIP